MCESLRVHGGRTLQRQILHLSELNTRQERSWQHTLDVINEDDGQLLQRRLFTDREGGAPPAEDIIDVRLSTLRVRQPRRFGDCWAATRLWRQPGLDGSWRERLGGQRGEVPWEKVLELLCANMLLDPRSELYVHEKWFPQTSMDMLLDCDAKVAELSRL